MLFQSTVYYIKTFDFIKIQPSHSSDLKNQNHFRYKLSVSCVTCTCKCCRTTPVFGVGQETLDRFADTLPFFEVSWFPSLPYDLCGLTLLSLILM